MVDGHPAVSCTTPVAAVEGKHVVTVEGLGDERQPHPLQRALLAEQAAQCGYCLSGIMIRAAALLAANPDVDEAAVRSALDANLCRCGAHNRIVRAVLRAAAAARLGEPGDALHVRDGEIVAASGKRSSYWELADAGLLERDATASVAPKGPGERGPIGENAPRLDLPDKVFGRPRYVHDLELPSMLHGRVLRPPSPAARLVALDDVRARAVAGVVAIVRDGRFAGVLAEREEAALKAVERLRADTDWEESETLPDAAKLAEWIRAQSVETTTIVEKPGAPVVAAATQRARFTRPFSAHASLGPASAVAQWNGDALHVWTHAQGVFNLRADLALTFALPAESILVEHVEGAGCYGHNAADDVALDAPLLAPASP